MLDRDVVLEIRKRYDRGYPRGEIAKGFGVSVTTVSLIGKRRIHKRVRGGGGGREGVKPYPIQQERAVRKDPD